MMESLQEVAIVVEAIALALIATELYCTPVSQQLTSWLENLGSPKGRGSSDFWVWFWIAAYTLACVVLSILDPALMIVFIVTSSGLFAVLTIVALMLKAFTISLRLGVLLGRGNAIGGIGMLLALIGFSMELAQLLGQCTETGCFGFGRNS